MIGGNKKVIEHVFDPYPDEILCSIWARHSDHVQYAYKTDIFQELFGKQILPTDLNSYYYLNIFLSRLPPQYNYTLDQFLNNHTLFPFYSPFLPLKKFHHLRQQLTANSSYSYYAKATAQIYPIGLLSAWLRYCPKCVIQDRVQFGECYWHRLHQIKGVEICPIHRNFLENSSVPALSTTRSTAFISAEQALQVIASPRPSTSSPYYHKLLNIVIDTKYLLQHSCTPSIHPGFMREQYLALLTDCGFEGKTDKRTQIEETLKAFMNYYPQELLKLLRCEIKPNEYLGTVWFVQTLLSQETQSRITLHPLHHILILHFLGCTVETFLNKRIDTFKLFGDGPWPCLNPVCERYHQRCIYTYHKNGGECHLEGTFSCTCGFSYTRLGPSYFPKDDFLLKKVLVYGSLWEKRLFEMWSDVTLSQSVICTRLGIPKSVLHKQSLRLKLPIPRNSLWTKSSRNSMQYGTKTVAFYREQWLTLIKENPMANRTKLREINMSVYTWLLHHDKEWLMAASPLRKSQCQK